MLKKLVPFLILFITLQGHTQNYFKGIVSEEDTSMTVNGAIVAVEGTSAAETTDPNGAFNFTDKIPDGEHVVTITKEGYVTKYLIIEVVFGKNIVMNNIKIGVTKKERKRREKAIKEQQKQEKEIRKQREKTIASAQKEKEKRDKELEKKKKKLLKQREKDKKNNVDDYSDSPVVYEDIKPEKTITQLQIKYGELLGVTPESITNTQLYQFIDDWEGTKYLMGGENKNGIDCSSFTLRLYNAASNKIIERTAQKQFDSNLTEKFLGKEHLKEGDLIFFNDSGDYEQPITHVGMYLRNNNFVHSSISTNGVGISNLDEAVWKRMYVAGGRRN